MKLLLRTVILNLEKTKENNFPPKLRSFRRKLREPCYRLPVSDWSGGESRCVAMELKSGTTESAACQWQASREHANETPHVYTKILQTISVKVRSNINE